MDRGALGVVLHFCRVAGVAPFHRQDEYRVSSLLVVCAKLVITFTAIDYMIYTATLSVWTLKYEDIMAFEILRWSTKLFVIIAAFISVFTSSERTLRLMRFHKELDKLDKQILGDYRPNIRERKLTILILIYLHVSLVIRFYDFLLHTSSENIGKNISQIHNIIKNLPMSVWGNSNEVQSVNAPLKLDKIATEKIQEPVKLIRQCVANYMHVCGIITTSVEGDSVLIVTLMMYYILHLLSLMYKLIFYAITSNPYAFEPTLVLAIYWFVIYSVTLVVFVEPIHKTQLEMQRIQLLLTSMMLKNMDKEDIHNELLLFSRVINLNKPTYSPLGLFNINRSLIVKIFGSLITYLVIIVTYGPETKKLSPSELIF